MVSFTNICQYITYVYGEWPVDDIACYIVGSFDRISFDAVVVVYVALYMDCQAKYWPFYSDSHLSV